MMVLPPDPLFRLKSDMGIIYTMCFVYDPPIDDDNPDVGESQPKLLLAAGKEGIVYFWDLETNRLKQKQQFSNDIIQSIHAYKSDQVIIQEKQGLISIFCASTPENYERLLSIPCCMGFCKPILLDNSLFIPVDQAATISLFDLNTQTTLKQISYDSCPSSCQSHCRALTASDFGQMMCMDYMYYKGPNSTEPESKLHIFAAFEMGDVLAWCVDNGFLKTHAKFQDCLTSLTLDAWNMRGVVGGTSNVLQVFSIDKQFKLTLKCELTLSNEGCQLVKVRPDRKVCVCGGFDGRVRIYSWRTLRILAVLDDHREAISDVQFSLTTANYWKSRIMAVAGIDGVITLWNLYN